MKGGTGRRIPCRRAELPSHAFPNSSPATRAAAETKGKSYHHPRRPGRHRIHAIESDEPATDNEAKVALSKAQDLMTRHNIDSALLRMEAGRALTGSNHHFHVTTLQDTADAGNGPDNTSPGMASYRARFLPICFVAGQAVERIVGPARASGLFLVSL